MCNDNISWHVLEYKDISANIYKTVDILAKFTLQKGIFDTSWCLNIVCNILSFLPFSFWVYKYMDKDRVTLLYPLDTYQQHLRKCGTLQAENLSHLLIFVLIQVSLICKYTNVRVYMYICLSRSFKEIWLLVYMYYYSSDVYLYHIPR